MSNNDSNNDDSDGRVTIAAAMEAAARRLLPLGSAARREAELLLASALDRPRSFLLSHAGERLDAAQVARLAALLDRRLAGESLAYVSGRKEFWSLDLEVDARVLVPRPETELLVELALDILPAEAHARVLDLGTGSGAIALAIAHERPNWRVLMTDVSSDALAVACRNAERLGLGNVSFEVGDWYVPIGAMHFDLIVSNPPYVSSGDPALEADGVRSEPRVALTPGTSGLEALQRIAERAAEHLRPGGWLAVEHGAEQAERVTAMFSQHGLSTIRSLRDPAGHARVTAGRRAP